ncbi:MAG: hypothetical protein RL662_64 [Bacteroidota bacterium]|jgi:hypothetical protein
MATVQMYAQEIQLHFDPRHALYNDVAQRNYFTATFQMFKPDKWGSTFGFVDVDFNQSRGNIGLAYLELSRDFKLGKSPVMAHIEFNGGIVRGDNYSGFSIPNSYLVGASYNYGLANGNLNTYLAYKYNAFDKVSNDMQWTLVWGLNFMNKKLTANGFLDIWTENKDRIQAKGGKKVIFLAEPQFWYNVNPNLAFGTEVEISNNFYSHYNNNVYVCPTLAGKWTF